MNGRYPERIFCGAILAVSCSTAALAYMSEAPGEAPQSITTIEELNQNGQKDVAREVQNALKRNGGKSPEEMEREFAEQQAREAEKKAAEEAEKAPARKPLVDAFPQQEKREPPAEGTLGGARGKERPQEGKGAFSQLKESAGGRATSDVPDLDAGQPVTPPPSAAAAAPEPKDEPAKMRANIDKICEKKAEDPRAKALCKKYLNDVAFQSTTFGGWLGKIQKAMKEDIKSGNLKNFPKIKFGEVPEGAAATWSGDPNGGDEPTITMGTFLDTLSKGTMKIADHEYRHHADAKHWDGSQLGVNPKQDVEPPCYATMGCLNDGSCSERM